MLSDVDRYQFQSYNFPRLFVRHRNFEGELTTKVGPPDDFSFTLVPRGAPNRVSLRSVNFPDRYLRHRMFRVWLEAPAGQGDRLFQQDSTFVLEPGLADGNGVSLRSVNYPDRFLRHRNFQLWVEAPADAADQLFAKDATFYRSHAPVLIDHGTALEPADG